MLLVAGRGQAAPERVQPHAHAAGVRGDARVVVALRPEIGQLGTGDPAGDPGTHEGHGRLGWLLLRGAGGRRGRAAGRTSRLGGRKAAAATRALTGRRGAGRSDTGTSAAAGTVTVTTTPSASPGPRPR